MIECVLLLVVVGGGTTVRRMYLELFESVESAHAFRQQLIMHCQESLVGYDYD